MMGWCGNASLDQQHPNADTFLLINIHVVGTERLIFWKHTPFKNMLFSNHNSRTTPFAQQRLMQFASDECFYRCLSNEKETDRVLSIQLFESAN